MRSAILTAAASAGVARAATLASVCTTSYVTSALPTDLFGMTIDTSSVTAAAVYNASSTGSVMFPDATFDFCNVTMAYSHNGRDDQVLLNFWLPSPASFKNRWLSTGGGGLAINSGVTTSGSLPGGVQYGAVSGLTDGGFGGFTEVCFAVLNTEI
jgi:tannase